MNKITALHRDEIRALIDNDWVRAHRAGRSADHPVMRGTAQNPDTCFQSRERQPLLRSGTGAGAAIRMDNLGELTGRHYRLVEYHGAPRCHRRHRADGLGGGYRPYHRGLAQPTGSQDRCAGHFASIALPGTGAARCATADVRRMAVLDRTKEPGPVANRCCWMCRAP